MKKIQFSIKLIRKNIKKWHILMGVIVFLFLLNLLVAWNTMQASYPIFGLRFQGKNISFLSQKQLYILVSKDIAANKAPLMLYFGEKTFPLSPSLIGYKVNPTTIVQTILQIGREGSFLQKARVQISALFGFYTVPLSGTLSKSLMTAAILNIEHTINSDPIPIHPDFQHNIDKTLPAVNGTSVDGQKLAALLMSHVSRQDTTPIMIPTVVVKPTVFPDSALQGIRQQLSLQSQQPITIISGGEVLSLSSADIKQMETVVERPDPTNSHKTYLTLRLNETMLNHALDTFATRVEDKTHTEFDEEDAVVAIYAQFFFNKRQTMTIPTGGILSPHVLGASTTINGPKVAYLTFDDGPNAIYHPLILDILKQYHVRATFFLIGQNVLAVPAVAIRTYADGHVVGNHTLTHAFLPNYTAAFISNEILKTNTILQTINGGKQVMLFRPPYGGVNNLVVQSAHQANLRVFLWDVDPKDWTEPATDVLVQRVINYVHQGSDVLLHSNHEATVRALPLILQKLIAEGYTFDTLDHYPHIDEL